ncbi:MAG: aminotransferase class V-fold PLP-dependent enzyme, partial [Ignavibacteriaceae bacterium]
HHGITTLIDAAQSGGHMPVDLAEMDCDFLVCSERSSGKYPDCSQTKRIIHSNAPGEQLLSLRYADGALWGNLQ